MGSLNKGTKVSVYTVKSGWATIDYKGQKRYVKAEFLSQNQDTQRTQSSTTVKSTIKSTPVTSSSKSTEAKNTNTKNSMRRSNMNAKTTWSPNYYGWNTSLELQPIFGLDKGVDPGLNLVFGLTKGLNEFASIGGTVGVSSNYHFNTAPSIPLTVRTIFEGKNLEVSPYGMFDAGFAFNLDDFDHSSIIINPTIGVRLRNLYLGVGYRAAIPSKSEIEVTSGSGRYKITQKTKVSTSNYLNLNIGYIFGNNDGSKEKIKRFFSHLHPSLEIGGSYYLEDNKYDAIGSLLADLKFALNYKIDDNWSVGIGTGADVELSDVEIVMPFYLRGKYHFLDAGSAIRPFVQLDAGFRTRIDDNGEGIQGGAFIEPAVGIQFSKFYVTAGLTSYHNNVYFTPVSTEKESYKAINAMVGIEF